MYRLDWKEVKRIKEILGHQPRRINKDQPWTLRNIRSEELSPRQRRKIAELLPCEICGKDKNSECHRLKRKGPYKLSNIEILCAEDHRTIHAKEPGTINR